MITILSVSTVYTYVTSAVCTRPCYNVGTHLRRYWNDWADLYLPSAYRRTSAAIASAREDCENIDTSHRSYIRPVWETSRRNVCETSKDRQL